MSARAEEHRAWNEEKGLKPGSELVLHCPRCQTLHKETFTSDPKEEDYMHHVHQCHVCGLRFDLFTRCRGDEKEAPSQVILDLVLTWTNGMPAKAGTASVLDGALIFSTRNHLGQFVTFTTPIHFDGEPSDGTPPRFVLRRLGPGVWKLSPSILDDRLHAYVTIVGVPELAEAAPGVIKVSR